MKKILTGILAGAMLMTALAIPAMAEDMTASETTAITASNRPENGPQDRMPGNSQNGTQGQMPGGSSRKETQNQKPGNSQNGAQSQMPGVNGQNAPQGQMPGNSQNGTQGQMPGGNGGKGTQNQMPGNSQNGAQSQMPGNSQNGAQSQMPSGSGRKGTQNQMSGNSQNGAQNQMPGTSGGKGTHGQKPGQENQNGRSMEMKGPKGRIDFKSLVEKGIIDQETYEKIEEFLKNNAPEGRKAPGTMTSPEKSDDGSGSTEAAVPEKNDDGSGSTEAAAPEKPEDDAASQQPKAGSAAPQDDLIRRLVEAGILTQEQADAIDAISDTAEDESAATVTDATNG